MYSVRVVQPTRTRSSTESMPETFSLDRQPCEIQVIRRYRLWPGGIETGSAEGTAPGSLPERRGPDVANPTLASVPPVGPHPPRFAPRNRWVTLVRFNT